MGWNKGKRQSCSSSAWASARVGTELCCPACGEHYTEETDGEDDLDEEADDLPGEHDDDW